jgi:hypothetical protein
MAVTLRIPRLLPFFFVYAASIGDGQSALGQVERWRSELSVNKPLA